MIKKKKNEKFRDYLKADKILKKYLIIKASYTFTKSFVLS